MIVPFYNLCLLCCFDECTIEQAAKKILHLTDLTQKICIISTITPTHERLYNIIQDDAQPYGKKWQLLRFCCSPFFHYLTVFENHSNCLIFTIMQAQRAKLRVFSSFFEPTLFERTLFFNTHVFLSAHFLSARFSSARF